MPKFMSLKEWTQKSTSIYKTFCAIPGCEEWSYNARGSRKNDIIRAVNSQIPKNEAGLKDEFEKAYYDYLWKTAELHKKAYGVWPAFDVYEIESDDERLEIYGPGNTPEAVVADRKAKREEKA